ncbi:MAG: hypothetical protein K8H88_12420 [Sandaracinaceae bacterium]|nr:hypothetical protein [Sandaracinaceae bacterium]
MKKVKKSNRLAALLRDERGLTTVEYIIILCLIAIVGFAVWKKFGATVKTKVSDSTDTIDTLSGRAE